MSEVTPIPLQSVVVDSPQEKAMWDNSIVSIAFPMANGAPLLTGEEDYFQVLSKFANSLEVFQNVFVGVASIDPNGFSRMLLTTALIPGSAERIPVYGVQEKKRVENGLTYMKFEVFVFNGTERIPTGFAHIAMNADKSPKNMQVYSSQGNHLLFSAICSNNNNGASSVLIYDSRGQLLNQIQEVKSKQKRKKRVKNRTVFEARESNMSNRLLAYVNLDIEKSGYKAKKKLKELSFEFLDPNDGAVKPQIFMASLLLLHMNKL